MVQHLLTRTAARTIAQIPGEVLEALNEGLIPTASLTEFLALDVARIARRVAAQVGLDPRDEGFADALAMLPSFPPLRQHALVARALYQLAFAHPGRDAVADALARHPSDIARCWAAQWVQCSGLGLAAKLAALRRFGADPHFGVREVAWMALRDEVVADADAAIALLRPWALEADANLRRFASEATRPRGVWCAQVAALKSEPWRGLPLLEPLKADPSRYVQNSVANWLNDAAKTQPQWVAETCARWQRESAGPATAYITRRARRSLPDAPGA